MSQPLALLQKHLFLLYVASNLLVGLTLPKFFAVLLPLSAAITLVVGCSLVDIKAGLRQPILHYTVLFIIFMFLTVPGSIRPVHSLGEAAQLAIPLLAIAVLIGFPSKVTTELSRQSQQAIFWLFLVLIILLLLLNIALMVGVLDWDSHRMNRQAVVFALFLWPVLMLLKDLKSWAYPASLTALLFVAIILGNSETALAMILTGIATFLFYKLLPLSRRIGAALLGAGMFIILAIPPSLAYLYQIGATKPYEHLIGRTLRHLQVWSETLSEVIAYMPFGAGINVTRFFDEMPESVSYGFSIHHPHSITLELLIDFGIFGLMLLAFIIYAGVKVYLLAAKDTRPFIAATIIAMLVLTAVAYSFWQESRTGYIAFALVIISLHLKARAGDRAE